MADFTSGFWTWFIGVTTVISIAALLLFVIKLSTARKPPSGEKAESVGHIWDEDLHELNTPLPRWWLNLFLITLVWGAVYLFLYPGLGSYRGYLGRTQVTQYEQEMKRADEQYGPLYDKFKNQDLAMLAKNDDARTIGKRLYATYCTTCHGSDARGARGFPNLRDSEWLYGGDPKSIETTILNGRTGAMPPWGAVLSSDDIFSTAEYVRTLSGLRADPEIAAKGQKIFSQYCAACHGVDGKGNHQLGAPDLTNDIWLYGGSQKTIIETITNGRNGRMPSHKEFLGEAKVHLLAAYIYSLSAGK
jgi:cytochrome c oxidase cbb3-type subunit 3